MSAAQKASAADLLKAYRPDLAGDLDDLACPPYRYAQVLEHLMRRPGVPIASATSLPLELRRLLGVRPVTLLQESARISSPDGTTKLLLKALDGTCIETVVMRYGQRATACVSTQAGCRVGCLFCATGALGFMRNLSVGEIVDQVLIGWATLQTEGVRISNVVYMGMGEPFLNLSATLGSIRLLTDPGGLGLSHRAISVSTVGIPSGIRRLACAEPQVNLAISLHAPDDDLRAQLIPSSFRRPLHEILEAAWEHFQITHRKLLVEYVLLAGINDAPSHAVALARLLKGHVVTVNLLAANVSEPVELHSGRSCALRGGGRQRALLPPQPAVIHAFKQSLEQAGIETVVRRSKGERIQAACGQLAGRQESYR